MERRPPDHHRRAESIREAFALIRQDVRDEEHELLPRLRTALTDRRLRPIGAAWETVRTTPPTHSHPGVARRPPANALDDVPLSFFDRLRDLSPVASPSARRIGTVARAAAGVIVLVMHAVRRR